MEITLLGSKSISNRLLIINALYGNVLSFQNLSTSQDTINMQRAVASSSNLIDIHHAGTAMRFLTAYFSIQKGREVMLTGSQRMQERPIGILVEALKSLHAEIHYEKNENYPPLRISGKALQGGEIEINGGVSSQYITALMLIGSTLSKGLKLIPKGNWVSLPYIEMTAKLQNDLGIPTQISQKEIKVPFVHAIPTKEVFIESDWSSASYLYEYFALHEMRKLKIRYLFKDSLQADSVVAPLFRKYFGVATTYHSNEVELTKIQNFQYPSQIAIDCLPFPDIAQTLSMTAVGLRIPIRLTGLDTLTIKETDRIKALKTELKKWNIEVHTTANSLEISSYESMNTTHKVEIETYQDHRMAMAFAPLRSQIDFTIVNPEVVQKSYPEFWQDMDTLNQQFL